MAEDVSMEATIAMLDLALGPEPTVDEQLAALEAEWRGLKMNLAAGEQALALYNDHPKLRASLKRLQKVRRDDIYRIERAFALNNFWPDEEPES